MFAAHTSRLSLSPHSRIAVGWALVLTASAAAYSFQFTSFLHAKDLCLAVGLVVMTALHLHERRLDGKAFLFFLPLWAGLAFWGLTGAVNAQVIPYHVEKWGALAFTLLAASLASGVFRQPGGRGWLWTAWMASGALIGALAMLQYAGWIPALMPIFPGYDQPAYSVFGNQNLLGGYLAFTLILSIVAALRRRRTGWGALLLHLSVFAIMLGGLLASSTRSAWLAAFLGGAYAVAVSGAMGHPIRTCRRWVRSGAWLYLATALLLLAASWSLTVTRATQTFSAQDVGGRARLWFWAGALQMIQEQPLLGVGLGNFQYWSPYYQGRALAAPGGEQLFRNELHTLHAHCEPLEWLAETGVLGMLFLVWFAWRLLRGWRRAEMAGLIALGVFACFNSFNHSNPHMLALLLAAAMVGMERTSDVPVSAFRHGGALTAATILCALLLAATVLVPSWLACAAEQTHIRGGAAEPLYQRALTWPWPNPRAHESYAILLMDQDRFAEARLQLEQAEQGLDTGRLHLLLAICAEASGDAEETRRRTEQCLYRWPGNAHARSLLNRPVAP